jgi:hypothetical protein
MFVYILSRFCKYFIKPGLGRSDSWAEYTAVVYKHRYLAWSTNSRIHPACLREMLIPTRPHPGRDPGPESQNGHLLQRSQSKL